MTAVIVWNEDGTGTAQEAARGVMRDLLTKLLRARLCARCRRPAAACRCRSWTFGAESIRGYLPSGIVLGGCAAELFGPPPALPASYPGPAVAFPQAVEEGYVAHTQHHFIGKGWHTRQFICCAQESVSFNTLAHELAHTLTDSRYSEVDGRWYAPHGVRWQRTFAAMGFAREAKLYARHIRAEDRRIHVEYDAEHAE